MVYPQVIEDLLISVQDIVPDPPVKLEETTAVRELVFDMVTQTAATSNPPDNTEAVSSTTDDDSQKSAGKQCADVSSEDDDVLMITNVKSLSQADVSEGGKSEFVSADESSTAEYKSASADVTASAAAENKPVTESSDDDVVVIETTCKEAADLQQSKAEGSEDATDESAEATPERKVYSSGNQFSIVETDEPTETEPAADQGDNLEKSEEGKKVLTREELIEACISALRLCIKRYPLHYKSYYRLARVFLHDKNLKVG